MNSIVLVFAAALAVAHAGILTHGVVGHSILAPSARTTHLQGPSASASIVGNDGSHIVSHAPGASITASEHAGGAAVAYSAPVLAHAAPAVVAHAAPAVAAYAAPAVATYAAPAVVAHAAPAVATYAAPAVLAHGAPVWAHAHAHSIWA